MILPILIALLALSNDPSPMPMMIYDTPPPTTCGPGQFLMNGHCTSLFISNELIGSVPSNPPPLKCLDGSILVTLGYDVPVCAVISTLTRPR